VSFVTFLEKNSRRCRSKSIRGREVDIVLSVSNGLMTAGRGSFLIRPASACRPAERRIGRKFIPAYRTPNEQAGPRGHGAVRVPLFGRNFRVGEPGP
jgi:hypothetical protein